MANTEHDARVEHIIKQAERELCEQAATITTLAAENARLLAFASSLADRDDSIGDDARAALNPKGEPHDQQ